MLAETRFRTLATAEPWEAAGTIPRRAAVDAFGFGGIDAHAVLEEASGGPARRPSRRDPPGAERFLALSAESPGALLGALDRNEAVRGPGSCRLVLFDPTPERRAMAQKVVAKERPWRGHDDLWFTPKGLLAEGGKTVFLFPGLEPQFEPRVDDVAARFGGTAPRLPEGRQLEEMGLAVVQVGRLLHQAVAALGLAPQAMAGHSLGEWTAMIASEMIPPGAAQAFIDSIVPGRLEVPDVLFAVAGCSAERATAALRGLADVALSHDNCPHQVILCGKTGAVESALARLRDEQVLCQKLPFRSGFHSPLFEPYLEPHRRHFASLPLQKPTAPLWSATSCAPYPEDPAAIRGLAIEHLVRPVRFRELVERLHGEGFRFFVQIGSGNGLSGFVEDTLRGKPVLAMSANVKQRSGLAQLRRLLAAAFCEGLDVDPASVDRAGSANGRPLALGLPLVRVPRLIEGVAAATPAPAPEGSTVMQRLAESLQAVARAQQEVTRAFTAASEDPPRRWSERRRLSVETHPYLLDHCFYRQPAGWAEVADRYPVVPMTLTVEWLREAAETLGAPVRVLEDVRALRWLPVAPPIDVDLRAEREGDRIAVSLEGFADATATARAPEPWVAAPPLGAREPLPLGADALYRDRWMFHGPAYQGVTSLTAWGPDGIDGVLAVPTGPGALLDNAGQLFGLWVMLRAERDHLALPVKLDRVELFAPAPKAGDALQCSVRIRGFDEREVTADVWLSFPDGRPFCRIRGWRDRRFDSDAKLWSVLRWPERELLASARPGGYFLVTDAWRTLPSRDLLARRYLGAAERAALEATGPRKQGQWLNGRIAVKDAVRDLLWRGGAGPLFPVEIQVTADERGRPRVSGPLREPVDVSIAHVEGAAVARVAVGRRVGIDLERPDARPSGFAELALSAGERRLLPDGDRWLARAWTAKEALGKARGTGLAGDPKKLPLQDIEGERLLIDGHWVETRWDEPYVVAWSELP